MPDNYVIAADAKTGAPVRVPLADYAAKVKAGEIRPTSDTVGRVSSFGGTETLSPDEAASQVSAGDQYVSGEAQARQRVDKAQAAQLTTWDQKLATFTEGMTDALSFGLLHERGDEADLRRQLNSGSAFAGELTGTLLGMHTPGPTAWVAGKGEQAGAAVAKALGEGRVVSRVAHEAAVGAALAGAGSLGHQTFDALIEHKDFAAEAVVKDLGLGALLGGGLGLVGAGAGRLGRFAKGDIEAQGGLMDPKSPESASVVDHINTAVSELDRVVDQHATRLGIARVIEDDGHLPMSSDYMADRVRALKAARAARAKLGDVGQGMANADPKFFKALDDYQLSVQDLDSKMALRDIEHLAARPVRLGEAADIQADLAKAQGTPPDEFAGPPGSDEWSNELAFRMRDPALRAKYEALHGEPYQPPEGAALPERYQELFNGPYSDLFPKEYLPEGWNDAAPSAEAQMARGPAEGSSPPDQATGNASPRARRLAEMAQEAAPVEPETTPEAPVNPEDARTRMDFPYSAGRVMLPEHLDALTEGAKVLIPSEKAAAADNLLHGEYTDRPLLLLKSGRYMPQETIEANRGYFADKFPSVVESKPIGQPSTDAEDAKAFSEYLDKVNTTRTASGARQAPPISPAGPGAEPPKVTGGVDELNRVIDRLSPAKGIPKSYRDFLDGWWAESNQLGPRITPGDRAAARIAQLTDKVYQATGGRADAVAALEMGPKYGLPEPRTALGERAQQAALLRQAADEVKNIARGAGKPSSPAGRWVKRRIFGRVGAMALGSAVGGHFAGEAGYILGASLAGDYGDLAGRVASSAGRTMARVGQAVDYILSGSRVAATSAVAAQTVNRAWAYSNQGAIQDPVARILDLKRVASNPDALRAQVRANLGDLPAVHPGLAQAVENNAVNRTMALSLRAPMIYFDALGQPMKPAIQAMRSWLEYENAAHGLDRVLDSVASGSATRTQIDALRDLSPVVYQTLVAEVLRNHEALPKMSRPALKYVEMVTGLTLTRSATPGMVARNAMAVAPPPGPAQGMGGAGPGRPQAFRISQNPLATPAQGAPSGRAPGN